MARRDRAKWAIKVIYVTALHYLIGFGVSTLVAPHPSGTKVFVGWILAGTLIVLTAVLVSPQTDAHIKHIPWTELAHQYAKLLKVEPRDVWIVEETDETWLARAESDRILVHWKVAQNYTDEAMTFIIAHEVAHYKPCSSTYHFVVVALVQVVTGICYAISPWWAVPIICVLFLVLAGVIETMRTRRDEFGTDRLAVQITSAQLALDTYDACPTSDKLWFLRKAPSFYERRRAIIRQLKSIDDLESRNRVSIHPPEKPKTK
jgi:Zn-dependent protease with chaperone function